MVDRYDDLYSQISQLRGDSSRIGNAQNQAQQAINGLGTTISNAGTANDTLLAGYAQQRAAQQAAAASQPVAALNPTTGVGGINPVSTGPGFTTGGADTKDFNPDFASKLDKFIAASGGRLSINSGYRSPERQAQLFAAAVKKYGSESAARKWVAPPGHSNHNKGLAADLGFNKDGVDWAHQNAAAYGLTFPLSNENWHVEPIGIR